MVHPAKGRVSLWFFSVFHSTGQAAPRVLHGLAGAGAPGGPFMAHEGIRTA